MSCCTWQQQYRRTLTFGSSIFFMIAMLKAKSLSPPHVEKSKKADTRSAQTKSTIMMQQKQLSQWPETAPPGKCRAATTLELHIYSQKVILQRKITILQNCLISRETTRRLSAESEIGHEGRVARPKKRFDSAYHMTNF